MVEVGARKGSNGILGHYWWCGRNKQSFLLGHSRGPTTTRKTQTDMRSTVLYASLFGLILLYTIAFHLLMSVSCATSDFVQHSGMYQWTLFRCWTWSLQPSFDVVDLSDETADDALRILSNTRVFIPAGGGVLSRMIASLVTKRRNIVLRPVGSTSDSVPS